MGFPRTGGVLETMGIEANWRRLAAAMLARAALDAQSEDPALAAPARRWLAGEGVAWAEWLGMPPERVGNWLADLPVLPWEQLALTL